MSSRTALALLVGANVLLGAIGTIGWRAGVPEPALFGAYLALGLLYLAAFIRPRWLLRRFRRAA
jgi:hypothetical protein